MANERITENHVRDLFREKGYYDKENKVYVEEQKSQIDDVKKLLKGASKTGKGGYGYPEFIVSSPDHPDFLVVVECKPLTKQHESKELNKPKDFAVDGVLHYAAKLSKNYNVIAIAVSGSKKTNLRISNFLFPKGSGEYRILANKHKETIDSIIPYEDYIENGSYDEDIAKKRHSDLMAFSRELHEFMRDHAKLTESEKPLMVSGTLIALLNMPFVKSYQEYKPEDLQKEWLRVIKNEIEKADIPNSKKNNMTQPYSTISVHPELGKATKKYPKGVLSKLITMLNEKVYPFIKYYHDYDVVGQFYGEFLKYTGGDKKALGIVLTPKHITELFSLIANVRKDSKVLDICAGTGGFLISAMHQMMRQANTNKEISYIKQECLIGIEQQPNMYTLAASNMILRGDGKANLYQGSCFDEAIFKEIKTKKCDVGLMNPPYSQSDEGLHELSFVNQMLNLLIKGGVGVAIVPVACVTAPHPMKEELLKHHTLKAVMSMPNELFYPVGVVTCIVVFEAHIPHQQINKKTWFGFWKDDGFIKTKHLGRINLNGNWPNIRDRWVESYRNNEVHPGESVMSYVGAEDEWIAEAYLETDYSSILQNDFEEVVKNYALFKLSNGL